uniref:Uncharacterized protein n=2 Tax=Cercopithecinae TaxID=9528 RepID=A0A8I5N1C7_PAPAN
MLGHRPHIWMAAMRPSPKGCARECVFPMVSTAHTNSVASHKLTATLRTCLVFPGAMLGFNSYVLPHHCPTHVLEDGRACGNAPVLRTSNVESVRKAELCVQVSKHL